MNKNPKTDKLTPFQPGESGNPNGAPKGKRVSTILKELLNKAAPQKMQEAKFVSEFLGKNPKATNAEVLAVRLLFNALVKGDHKAVQEIIDRTEGKAMQQLSIEGETMKKQVFVINGKTIEF